MKLICRYFIVTFCLFVSCSTYSQKTKTVYLDIDWNETKKENAQFFQQVTKTSSEDYKVEVFYNSGQLQMSGQYQDKKLMFRNGEFVFYDTIGNLKKIEHYVDDMRNGIQKKFYSNGQVKMIEDYVKDKRNGIYREFYEDSTNRASATFTKGAIRGQAKRYSVNGTLIFLMSIDSIGNGDVTTYYLNGDIRKEGEFIDGVQSGVWNYYNRDSQLAKSKDYPLRSIEDEKPNENNTAHREVLVGEFFSGYDFGNEELSGLVYYPDIEAHFLGGEQELQRYISSFILYPEKAIEKNISGSVLLSFVVESDGSITNIVYERGHKLFKQESIRVVQNMPVWAPAEVNHKKVRTRCRLPIVYAFD